MTTIVYRRQAARPRRSNIVGGHDGQHRGARHARNRGERKQRERYAWQNELAQRRAEEFEIAGEQAVDQIKSRYGRRRVIEHVEPAQRRRRPAEAEIEHVDQQQAGEKYRQRHAGRGDDAASVVDPGALFYRRQDAERDGDEHGNHQAEQRQFGRCRQPRGEFGEHRPSGGERIPEIAVSELADIARELLWQRLVQPQRLADLGDRLRRRGGAGEIDRRIAGEHARQQKCDDDDADQRRKDGHEPAKDVGEHGGAVAELQTDFRQAFTSER